jgi:hypothetical protein
VNGRRRREGAAIVIDNNNRDVKLEIRLIRTFELKREVKVMSDINKSGEGIIFGGTRADREAHNMAKTCCAHFLKR